MKKDSLRSYVITSFIKLKVKNVEKLLVQVVLVGLKNKNNLRLNFKEKKEISLEKRRGLTKEIIDLLNPK